MSLSRSTLRQAQGERGVLLVWEWDHPHPFERLRTGLTFPRRGGRDNLDSGLRRNDGYAKALARGKGEEGGDATPLLDNHH